jgi:hypothetical protein
MHWMADGAPADLKAFGEMSIVEYFMMLDKKIAETKKEAARLKKRHKNG